MRNLIRGIPLLLIFLLASVPVFASSDKTDLEIDQLPQLEQAVSDSATVRVIPNEAPLGGQHTILVTGLEANEAVTVRIILEATGSTVYTTDELASSRGIVEVEIFTEADDVAGIYLVEVVNADDVVIGTDTFTALEVELFEAEITLSPQEAEFGSTFTIEIVGLRPFVVLEVTIDNEDGEEIYEERLRATVDGAASIEFESDADNTGVLSVKVVEDETNIIFEQDITVLGQVFPTTIVIEPSQALPGDTVFVTVTGLIPDEAVRVDITLDGDLIDSIDDTANVSGLLIFPYDFEAESALGQYDIQVYQNEELVGEQILTIDVLPVTVEVTPTVGTVGTVFFVTVGDLRVDETITVEFLRDDELVQSRTITADADGIARTTLGQRVDLALGTYSINVVRLDTVIHTQTVEVAEDRPETPIVINPDDVSITVDPLSGEVPTLYTITVSGLPADTNITLFILRDSTSVFSTSGTSDADGIYTLEVTSEESDPIGTYTAEVRADGQVLGSADFAIGEASPETDDDADDSSDSDTPSTNIGDVVVTIAPVTLRQGERVEFFITELEPNETITFELLSGDEIIYTTDSTADSNGATSVALVARDDEALGTYDVRILRDGDIIATDSFEIVDSATDIDSAQVRVEPDTGAQGTEYTIIVTDLEADETVDIVVTLDDESIYETERTADASGTVTVTLNSDQTDAIGTYDVRIIRDAGDLQSTLTITEGSDVVTSDNDNTSDAVITVSPIAGEIGTVHTITVTGLNPDETFGFILEFDGEVVYSVERTADDDGMFSTDIVAAEGDDLGDYDVIIERDDSDNLTAILTVSGDVVEDTQDDDNQSSDDFNIEIVPNEVDELEPFDVVITGLASDEAVDIAIIFDGETVFETNRSADENGEITLNLATEEGDPTGTYTVTVTRGDDTLSADVLVLGDDNQDDDVAEDPIEPSGDVQVTVTPSEGDIGTSYEFLISGLGSNEEFDIIVEFDGEAVFETSRTADASGFFTITLESSDDDDAGTYTLNVIRAGDVVASTTFDITTSTTSDPSDDSEGPDNDESTVTTITGTDTDEDTDTISEPPVEAIEITYADAIRVEFDDDNAVQVVEFDGNAGDVITVNVDSGGKFDTVATLISPTGEVIASDDDGGLGFDPEIERTVLPDSGTYQLEIRPFTEGEQGEALVTISRNDVRTLDADEIRTVILDSKTTTDILTFDGQAGEVISLVVELADGDVGALIITAEQADTLLMNYQTFGLPQTVILGFVVPNDGTVVIRIEDDGTTQSTFNIEIERD